MTGEALSVVLRLRSELDRREKIAAEADLSDEEPGGSWYAADGLSLSWHEGGNGLADFDAEFIAANEPADVLRTIQAHRRILDDYENSFVLVAEAPRSDKAWADGINTAMIKMLGYLAFIYFPEES